MNGDRPPQQACEDGDTADHCLNDSAERHHPGVDKHLFASASASHRKHDRSGDDDDKEGQQAVAELDGLVNHRDLSVADRDEATGEALRPRRATESRVRHAHHRAGDSDAALRQDHDERDDFLRFQRGER